MHRYPFYWGHADETGEGAFLEELRAEICEEAAAAPTDADGFIAWFEGLKVRGQGRAIRYPVARAAGRC